MCTQQVVCIFDPPRKATGDTVVNRQLLQGTIGQWLFTRDLTSLFMGMHFEIFAVSCLTKNTTVTLPFCS